MWGLENTATAERLPTIQPGAEPPEGVTAPALGEPGLQLLDVAEPARQAWRAELASLGGPSPLLDFEDSRATRIDLTSTHPGGLARFIAGKRTRLSSLIRESFAWRSAQSAAEAILTSTMELATARGIDALRLGIVVASWRAEREVDGETVVERVHAPVLLRPVGMRRVGEDFEVRLRGRAELNPSFAAALAERYGIVLDPVSFPALAESGGAFTPNAVIDRLRGLTAHLDDVQVEPRLVLGSFAEVAGAMVRDAATLAHPVLDAIAGNQAAVETVRESFRPVAPVPSDARTPQTDSLLLDADDEQEQVIAQLSAGNSVVVRTIPGSGTTQTIVNALGSLVADGKRVLVVGPRRASLLGIRDRLEAVGLPGVVASPRSARRDAVLGITRNERAVRPETQEVDEALVRLRSVIRGYRDALVATDPGLGVTALDCIAELSRLAAEAPHAATTARLPRWSVESLASPQERGRMADVLVTAAGLGGLSGSGGSSAWLGAQFGDPADAVRAHRIAERLSRTGLPELIARGTALIDGTHMRMFQSVHELGIYLRLLIELRDTLDRFQPSVFDRSISELVAATAPKREHPEMSNADRRRLVKLAQDYQRPGVRVPDLHAALAKIQKQRILWHRYVAEGAIPRVPVGLSEALVAWQAVEQDLLALDQPLRRADERSLTRMGLEELQSTLAALAEEQGALEHLQERTALMGALHQAGLDALVRDLGDRAVAPEAMADELELAWWTSALAALFDGNPALLAGSTETVDRLEADFRVVDEAHARQNAAALAWRLAEQWSIGLVDWPEEAAGLRALLRGGEVSSAALHRTAPHLIRAVNPVWMASPYEIAEVDPTLPFDTVILVDAGEMTVAESALAVRRGRQVVAFGDPATQAPSPFRTMVSERPADAAAAELGPSILDALGGLLPTVSLTRSYRAGGEDLAELVNRRFYAGRMQTLPWSGAMRGIRTLHVERIDAARGMLNEAASAVESPDAEVQKVVELVAAHARTHPDESLMVVTPSPRHATRVLASVLDHFQARADLAAWITAERDEPFEVVGVGDAVSISRDRVIFSLGYGRTAHGRVLTDFGPLSGANGERYLASALSSARRGLTIVTAIGPEDVDRSRFGAGPVAFAEVLEDIATTTPPVDRDVDGDPMIADLAERLRARGLTTRVGYRGMLPLVAAYGGAAVVVESDADLLAGSLRESLRLRPQLLRRFGWHYARVHAFELFQDPDLVADRIAELLGAPVLVPPPVVRRATAAPAAPVSEAAAAPAAPVPAPAAEPASELGATPPESRSSFAPTSAGLATAPDAEPLEETASGFETGPSRPRDGGWLLSDDLDAGQV